MNEKNIYQRVQAIMSELPGVKKNKTNTHGNYKFAGHEEVTAALRGLYIKHGIVRGYQVTKAEPEEKTAHLHLWVDVIWTNVDNPAEQIVSPSFATAPCQTKGGAPTAQQSGVALSYAIKNAEFKLFSLKGDDSADPEGMVPIDDDEAGDFISEFELCQTMSDVKEVVERVKKKKGRLGHRREDIMKAYHAAKERLSDAPAD